MQADRLGASSVCDSALWTIDEVDAFVRTKGMEAPAALRCAVSLELMTDPVRTEHGGAYERTMIERWIRQKATDPLTNLPLRNRALTPQGALQAASASFRDFCVKRHPGCDGLFTQSSVPAPSDATTAAMRDQMLHLRRELVAARANARRCLNTGDGPDEYVACIDTTVRLRCLIRQLAIRQLRENCDVQHVDNIPPDQELTQLREKTAIATREARRGLYGDDRVYYDACVDVLATLHRRMETLGA